MSSSRRTKRALFSLASVPAVFLTVASLATPGQAQDNSNTVNGIEQVTVTSTRITTPGFDAPTPTTVVSARDLANLAEDNIFTAVQQLPSLLGSTGVQVANNTTSTGNTGLSAFGLHGLGTNRVLTLIDSQRVVPAYVTGIADISQFPSSLVQRVDVVTGGASSSWGSDAVAGVVNFVTNKTYNGFKANVEAGETTYNDDQNLLVQLTAGSPFANDRGHIEVAAEYNYEAGVGPGTYGVGCAAGKSGRCWYSAPTTVAYTIAATPAGLPQNNIVLNAQDTQLARYGLITAGPLTGIAFNGQGQPYQFQYGVGLNGLQGVPAGNAAGTITNCVSVFCVGGDTSGNIGMGTSLAAALARGNIYGRVSYDLTPSVNVWATFIGSQVHTVNVPTIGAFRLANLTVQCGNAAGGPNAYLPASINTACVSNNITNFQYGTDNGTFPNGTVINQRDLDRVVVGADGSLNMFGSDWTWDSYAEHGVNDVSLHVRNIFLVPYYNAAIDAVAGPNGSIVCRSTVAQAEGCIPINIFGGVAPLPGALNWIYGNQQGHQITPAMLTNERQEAASASINGTPFADWAGMVSVAFGAEYREESYRVTGDPDGNGGTTDPLLSSAGNNWFAGNFHSGQGNYHVSEAFLETVVPLIHDDQWGKADLDLAGRATDYSTAGYVSTWKVGLTWDTPIDGLKFRSLMSRDVRAPNLSELFAAPQVSNNQIVNNLNAKTLTVQFVSTGNPALVPEKSANTQLGVVLQPSWFPGFSTSVDYYRVDIKQGISSLSQQTEVNLCQLQGYLNECAAIVTLNNVPESDPTSVWTQVKSEAFNLSYTVTDGFDLETSYQFSLDDALGIPGDFVIRALGNHVSKFLSNSGVPGTITTEGAGAGSTPSWQWLGIQNYSTKDWGLTFTEKWISQGVLSRASIFCTSGCPLPTTNNPTTNYNFVPSELYFAIGGNYNFDDHWQAYFKVDNVANVAPPISPSASPNQYGANATLYDTIGRMFHVGFRFNN